MMKRSIQDRIRGLFLGIAIGDALGMPAESKTPEVIKEKFGRIEDYIGARGMEAGQYTDDTQLTIAVTEAIIEAGGHIDMDKIAKWHVKALNESSAGWGWTTQEAVEKIAKGMSWEKSGDFGNNENRGWGNGIPMKIAPLGVVMYFKSFSEIFSDIAPFAIMTHRRGMAVSSGLAHTLAVYNCLKYDELSEKFWEDVHHSSFLGRTYVQDDREDDITDRLRTVPENLDKSIEELKKLYGDGTCYVYNSLPFSYAIFGKNPYSIDCVYNAVNAGGDADTNASIVGGLLGALNGTDVFPKHLLTGLKDKDRIIDLADRLYAVLEKKE